MKHNYKKLGLVVAVAAGLGLTQQPLFAAEVAEEIEEVVTIGTRSHKERSASDSPVPVDIISEEDLNAIGGTADLTDNLKAMVPSFTATPATGDGSAFVRPTSLRGLAPDQTLILVNGKRRHRAALVQFFAPAAGNGSHGADIGLIPGMALKRIEVLRDGAAAQYGSDAIAGVINLVTKDNDEGITFEGQFGQFLEGEDSYRYGVNAGFPLGNDGFVNLTVEAFDNEALSRGIQRPDAQGLINAGVQGVGADSPFGDGLAQSWGRPESNGLRTFMNASLPLNDRTDLYMFGNYSKTEGRYRFFYRNPITHGSIQTLRALGFNGLQAGYTPFLDGEQTDISFVTGLDGEFKNGMFYDFSISYGENELDYFLNNTLNASLGLINGQPAQRNFDVGAYKQEEINVNMDFSNELSDTVNIAFGFEWRDETYIAKAGEVNSYVGAGSNGLRGIAPQDAGEFGRANSAAYVDIEHDMSDDLLLQYAARIENFSDFGSTRNGKIALRYNINEQVTFRAAVSTGFHAPTPGQSNVKTTLTTFDGTTGLQVEEGLIKPTDPLALAVGGAPLKEEESFNLSTGITAQIMDNTTITLDLYKIDVDDKIYRTRDLQSSGRDISFYTNAIDIESKGIDLVVTTSMDWGNTATTNFSWAFSHNRVSVTDQRTVSGQAPVPSDLVEDIENNYPQERWVMTANTLFGDQWSWMVRANYYGEHFDERGTINAASNPSAEVESIIFVDTEINYQMNEDLRFTLGAVNLFDDYVDEIGAGNSNRLSVGLQYPRRSAANYEGGSWYLRARYTIQ